MALTKQESKQIVKNLLSGGDIWTLRIANNPLGELKVGPLPRRVVEVLTKTDQGEQHDHQPQEEPDVSRGESEQARGGSQASLKRSGRCGCVVRDDGLVYMLDLVDMNTA